MFEIVIIAVFVFLLIIFNKLKSGFVELQESNKTLNDNIKVLNSKINGLSKLVSQEEYKTPFYEGETDIVAEPEPELEPEVPMYTDPIPEVIEEVIKETEKVTILNTADTVNSYTAERDIASEYVVSEKEEEEEEEAIVQPPKQAFWERFKEKNPDLEKFIGENLINKLGILILVLGISYFVKFAIDKDWINEPARVGIGVLCGTLVMFIANKLRKNYAAFSSVLVAGAIAIFYFTIAIAFHEYKLFGQEVAFAIMVVITIFSCLVSLSYNRMELAVLALIGGFAVPFMISTGSGNYVVLFTYIIILNIGITLLAFYKKWRLVNTLAFIFTIVLFGGWFIKDNHSESPHYLGTLLFAFAFYLIFVVTNIINNLKTKAVFTKGQLVMLFASTVFFFTVGMVTLNDYHPEFRGLFTTGLALLNLFFAWFLFKKFKLDKVAVYMLIGLTLTFITLAIPIQFQGNYITLFWAAEAVLLMWLAKKSNIGSYRFASVIVHGLSILSLVIDWSQKYHDEAVLNIVFNPIFGTGIFVVATIVFVYFLLKKETVRIPLLQFVFDAVTYRKIALISGVVLLYIVGLFESFFQAVYHIEHWNSALAIPAVYHLLFTAVVAFVLFLSKKEFNLKIANSMACVNIILFVFVFLGLPFLEHTEYIGGESTYQIAFYLHYVMLALTLFFAVLLYRSNKNKVVFSFFKHKAFIWVAAFVLIFMASREVLLHGLKLLLEPIQSQNIAVYSEIAMTTEKIVKTSFPVLWGVLAFIFLILGIKKQIKSIRIIALVLLGITIVKLFTYDINNISETGKIIAFILLGVLILIISFVYQKLRVLVIDDTKDPIDEDED
ncbi:DUF2339 domain-containing protein [Olleya sp. HaHaR_3_96]|uniref:DUF2339 domain-containing protein n=1 Tax=Olleya sp. HaHaR_3_96 TaxID=2745560 RepID=UPI001C4E7C12|nr:DUF2339 domain-containing protein [Olleya sp. HaHaR_3_96]QXP60630.1 DUF2339 domain-containing protein [Olleya sp. HaHaR_3_96]